MHRYHRTHPRRKRKFHRVTEYAQPHTWMNGLHGIDKLAVMVTPSIRILRKHRIRNVVVGRRKACRVAFCVRKSMNENVYGTLKRCTKTLAEDTMAEVIHSNNTFGIGRNMPSAKSYALFSCCMCVFLAFAIRLNIHSGSVEQSDRMNHIRLLRLLLVQFRLRSRMKYIWSGNRWTKNKLPNRIYLLHNSCGLSSSHEIVNELCMQRQRWRGLAGLVVMDGELKQRSDSHQTHTHTQNEAELMWTWLTCVKENNFIDMQQQSKTGTEVCVWFTVSVHFHVTKCTHFAHESQNIFECELIVRLCMASLHINYLVSL